MKKLFLIICILGGIISANAQANKKTVVETNVSDVTVFIKGAQVVRKTDVNFPVGKSTLRFTNLSPCIDAKSVQVKIDGEVMVLSVNHQLNCNCFTK
ncbi:MAG: DUF4140 domain-containing protein [Prevotellaceae bacterium]|jgi:hypothetical protein|nr:DUF4140 domain-containing protein [Prevotellaceae bacterium]